MVDLVPELAVSDWQVSRHFYCAVLGFAAVYERPEEGFSYLRLGQADLMIDQIGLGRTFGGGHQPQTYPFGKGVNLQIRVAGVDALLAAIVAQGRAPHLPAEERWYRCGDHDLGQRQFMVADPDGYLLRFYQDLGMRPSMA